jgi:FdhD protein
VAVERIRAVSRHRFASGAGQAPRLEAGDEDRVVVEEPLEIRLDGVSLAVVMRTPGHDIELAAGLLVAEEILLEPDDVATIAHCREGTDPDLENVVNVRLMPAATARVAARRAREKAERSLVSSASCGVCGKRTIESLHAAAPPFETPPRLEPEALARLAALPEAMRTEQPLFDATGGLHATAVYGPDGRCLVLREDVGRHNALDKCVGHLFLREQLPVRGAVLALSGRSSFEMVQKALVARIQTLVAVGAPSSLAVELARASNMGLCGFARDGRLSIYAGL